MKESFINKCFNYITKHNNYSKIQKIKIRYGLEVMYHFFTKAIVIIILSLILNIYKYTMLMFLFFGVIRSFACGLHAKSNLECWIFSIFIYVSIGLYLKYVYINEAILYILLFISFLSIILFAPADTTNLPLVNKKKRISLKLKSILVSFVYICIFIFTNNFLINEIICISLLLESILINPFIYEVTKNKFNNYKEYNC